MSIEARKLFTDAFMRWMNGWQAVELFRQVSHKGIPIAEQEAFAQSRVVAEEMGDRPEYANIFHNSDFDTETMKAAFAEKATEQLVTSINSAIDGASLVYVHAFLEAITFDYLKVVALTEPSAYQHFIKDKKVSITDTQNLNADQIREKAIKEVLKEWEIKPLIFKIDKLFALCPPPESFSPIKDFTFDNERMKRLDSARHDVAHHDGIHKPIPNIEEELRFLNQCCLYLGRLVIEKYHYTVDWNHIMQKPHSLTDLVDIYTRGETAMKEHEAEKAQGQTQTEKRRL